MSRVVRFALTAVMVVLGLLGSTAAASADQQSDNAYLATPVTLAVDGDLYVVGAPADLAWRDVRAACPGTSKHAAQLVVAAVADRNLYVHRRCSNGTELTAWKTLRAIP